VASLHGRLFGDEPRLPYADRQQGGRALARALAHLKGRPRLQVLALPRGGVAVGFEVAVALAAPLDVFIVRKLGHPGFEEFAIGAVASGGVEILLDDGRALAPAALAEVRQRELEELARRERLYRGDAPPLALADCTVVVVDDGLATGASMRAAAMAVRRMQPAWLCVAVPVGPAETCHALREHADEVVCPATPSPFRAVGLWYRDFPQATDTEVRQLLAAARQGHPA
jgi:putative phosphoribosyl transferase